MTEDFTNETGRTDAGVVDSPGWASDAALSSDGTAVGYRTVGKGPGLVVVHGAMQWSLAHAELAAALSDTFTVHLIDRRGRGDSGPHGPDHSLATEVSDVEAVVRRTGATFVFGVSSGAIIALAAAREVEAVRAAAIFEPPLFPDAGEPARYADRCERASAAGDMTGALIVGMKGARMGPGWLRALPDVLLRPMVKAGMKRQEKTAPSDSMSMLDLAPTLRYDLALSAEASRLGHELADAVEVPLLLISGDRSPAYLRSAVDELASRYPDATRIRLPKLGHSATGDTDRGGDPARVAAELRSFFTAC